MKEKYKPSFTQEIWHHQHMRGLLNGMKFHCKRVLMLVYYTWDNWVSGLHPSYSILKEYNILETTSVSETLCSFRIQDDRYSPVTCYPETAKYSINKFKKPLSGSVTIYLCAILWMHMFMNYTFSMGR